ncbi:MAG: hypothetical protein V4468_12815 [Pseudomonadota bacterium]
MKDRGDEVRAGISRETRPGAAARYQRWIGALTMMLGLALASPLAAADTLPRAQVASACAPFLMAYFIGEEREDLLHIERNSGGEYVLRMDAQSAELHVISGKEELSELARLLHVDTIGECVLHSPGGLYVKLPVGSRVNKTEVVKTGYVFVEIGIQFGAKGLNSAGKAFIASISTVYPVNREQAVDQSQSAVPEAAP